LIYLPCDDGNLISGDGCSSTCQVESDFICSNDKAANPASHCKFKGRVKLSLNGIYKVANQNQISIIFDIYPYNDILLKMDLVNSVHFNSTGSNLTSSSIASKQVILKIAYFSNVEGNSAKISIQFDSSYVISPNFYLTFDIVDSSGLSLVYSDSSSGPAKRFDNIMTYLGIYSLILLLLGSFAYRMIGV
jgi:hypothetical protein